MTARTVFAVTAACLSVITHARASAAVVPPAKARRIAAQWGGSLTYLPTWAPAGVAVSDWWSETCACGTDDSRLVVRFTRQRTRLEWEVSDPGEIHRHDAGIVCRDGKFAAGVVRGRALFFRRRHGWETAWMCIPVTGTWGPGFVVPKLTISVRQRLGRAGQLRVSELERMVASARPSPPGRTRASRYELPARTDVVRMARSFRRPLFLPTKLPGGFIFSRSYVAAHADSVDRRRRLDVVFGRDSLFRKVVWLVFSGIDTSGFDCPRKDRPRPLAVIDGRAIYVNEAIHGVSVWTCMEPHNSPPLEVSLWYDIRLHSRTMLRLAMRMVGTARRVRIA
jgi:hypothetical protein